MAKDNMMTGYIIGSMEAEDALDAAHTAEMQVIRLKSEVLSLRQQNRQSRAAAAGKDAVRRRLVDALAEVAPNHPLANPVERNPLRNKIYAEAADREYDRNTPGAYDPDINPDEALGS
ncbi:MAG: hypothetical protein HZC22_19390 [Rhodocyclales bacterium]|nr:hypothetical protein [Rhodocyclales bacterium]